MTSIDTAEGGAPPPRHSILITSFRSLRFLDECLGSLLNLEGPTYEVLFLDNGSPDAEAEWVRTNIKDPRFRVFEVEHTRYFAGGVNTLAREAKGEYLVLLNSDARVEPDWLRRLDDRIRETGYEVISSDVREASDPLKQQNARWRLDWCGRTHLMPDEQTTNTPMFRADGCGMAIRRDVYEEAGGLDDDYKMYFEEVDLCWRLNMLDYRIGYAPGAIIHHVGQGSTAKSFFLWNRFRGRRNRIWTYFKNAGPLMLTVFVPTYLVVSLASIVAQLARGNVRNAWAETAAIAAAYWNLNVALSKRGVVQRMRRVDDATLNQRGLVVRNPF
jgi:N-acetylglucosaminyl-diphospho-decaprenol L-rhamnosyltransferase